MVQQILKTKGGKWALALVIMAVLAVIGSISEGSTEYISGAFLLLIIATWLVITEVKKIQNPPTDTKKAMQKQSQPVHEHKVSVTAKTSSYDVERLIAEGIELLPLDLGGYRSPSGGFVNWAYFEVKGTNSTTGRQNTRRYTAKDETAAAAIAEADGLNFPYEITALPNDAPTDRQINYLRSWNVAVPKGAAKEDISAILSRLEDSYDTVSENQISQDTIVEYIHPLPGPNEEFAKYAHDMGVLFSRYIGGKALFHHTVYNLKDYDRAAFFAYCVLCSHYNETIRDLRSSGYADQLYSFADMASVNESLMRSIGGRFPDDYMKPHKGSTAYKAVAEFFGIK